MLLKTAVTRAGVVSAAINALGLPERIYIDVTVQIVCYIVASRTLEEGKYQVFQFRYRMLRISKYSAIYAVVPDGIGAQFALAFGQKLKAPPGFAACVQSRILRASKHSSKSLEDLVFPLFQLSLKSVT